MLYVGLDPGKRRDPSAIVVVQRRETYPGYQHSQLHSMAVRYVEALPLGTPYVAVVERVKEVMNCPALAGDRSLTVDGTGVGTPVLTSLPFCGRLPQG